MSVKRAGFNGASDHSGKYRREKLGRDLMQEQFGLCYYLHSKHPLLDFFV